MKQIAAVFLATPLLAACSRPDTTMSMSNGPAPQTAAVPAVNQSRITIHRIGVFEDELAYQDRRGVYAIRDESTGKEFIGISGVGITETGSHQSGKTRTTDER